MWKAIRYRRAQALVIAALAALITACAVFAPLYDRALQQALVATRLAQQPPEISGLNVTSSALPPDQEALPTDRLAALVPADIRRYARPPVPSTVVNLAARSSSSIPTVGSAIWREGMCTHVSFASGDCPTGAGTIAVSTADAKLYGWQVGSRLTATETGVVPLGSYDERFPAPGQMAPPQATFTVAGIYRFTPGGDYWYGKTLTGRSGVLDPDSKKPQFDDWLMDQKTIQSTWVVPTNEVDFPLDKGKVGIDQLLLLGPAMERFVEQPLPIPEVSSTSLPTVRAYSGLPAITTEVAHGRDQARVIVPLLMTQLALLAIVVLWLVLGAATEQRRPEVALARLRGFGEGGARRRLLLELGPVVLAGVPAGAVVAVGLSYLSRHLWLAGGPPFELGVDALVALLIAVALLIVVTALAVRGVSREPVSALLRRVPSRRTGWAMGVADAIVITGSVVAVVAFAAGELTGPIALVAPALLALAVGLVLAHLIVPVAASVGRSLLTRGRVDAGVGVLHMARRPATRRLVTIITVATALLVFSSDALVVGARNRGYRADREVGAAMVATVNGTDLVGVRAALHEVDPSGLRVTPVVQESPPGAGITTQAVLPGAFRHIALFPGQRADAIAWDKIAPPEVAPLEIHGTSLALRLVTEDLQGGGAQLRLRLIGSNGQLAPSIIEELPKGTTAPRTVQVLVPCAKGCLLTGLALDLDDSTRPETGSLTIDRVVTSNQEQVQIGPASHWQPFADDSNGTMTPTSTSAGALTVAFDDSSPTEIVMSHASLPERLPALVAGPLPVDAAGQDFQGVGLDGVKRDMTSVGTLPFAPGGPAQTSVVNLDVLQRGGASLQFVSDLQILFADADPALLHIVTVALDQRGIELGGTTTAADARRNYDQSAAAWGLQLAVLVGAAALIIAALVLVVVAAATWRLRAHDFAALRMAGVSRRRIGAMAASEQLPIIVLAAVVGAVCGVVGAHFALPMVPLFALPPAVSTLDLATAWPAALAAGVGALVVLTLVGWLCGRWVAGRSRLARVRESL